MIQNDRNSKKALKLTAPRMVRSVFGLVFVALIVSLAGSSAWAAEYFVLDTVAGNGINPEDAQVTTTLVKNAVTARPGDALVQDEIMADYVLQPRLLKLGDDYIMTVEKMRAGEIIFTAQTKVNRIEDLDRAARRSTRTAMVEPQPNRGMAETEPPAIPYTYTPPEDRSPASEGAPSTTVIVNPEGRSEGQLGESLQPRKLGYLSLGLGPVAGRHMKTDNALYSLMAGYTWDLAPRASIKVLGEGTFSTGDENARFFNLGAGATFFLPGRVDGAPFLTGDIGYGWAEENGTDNEASGASVGVGAGYQFFRNTEATLDVLLRYAAILDTINGDGNPQIIGLRVAVNF